MTRPKICRKFLPNCKFGTPDEGKNEMKHRILFSLFMVLNFMPVPCIQAQITLDGTVGPASSLSGPNYEISADLGKQTGANLFHSFGLFNVNTGESATFTGPDTVSNIIARVTGGNPSLIDGPLRSEISGANLFLLNPRGLMFGTESSIDLTGSFHASTADYLGLGSDGRFDAAYPENSIFTSAPPSAFGFIGDEPGDIGVEGSIKGAAGQTLSLTGGNVSITGGMLEVQSGQIHIAGVASPGEIELADSGPDISAFEKQGEISVSQGAVLNVSGNNAGDVRIRGGKFVIRDPGSDLVAVTGNADGGEIDIEAKDKLLIADAGRVYTDSIGNGRGGDISVSSNSLTLSSGGMLFTRTQGEGIAGDIIANADEMNLTGGGLYSETRAVGASGDILASADSLTLSDGGRLFTRTLGDGRAGDISLNTNNMRVIRGGALFSFADVGVSGDTGNLSISADDLTLADDGSIVTETYGTGRGGDVQLDTDRLNINSGGFVRTLTALTGSGGNIAVIAQESVAISGFGTETLSGLYSNNFGSGDGGNISISADTLAVSDEGLITSDTVGENLGSGGDIALNVRQLEIDRGHISSSGIAMGSQNTGDAGNISIFASESVNISGSGKDDAGLYGEYYGVFSQTQGTGNGGSVSIKAEELNLTKDAMINAQSYAGGSGGKILLEAERIGIHDGGAVAADAYGTGRSGDISVSAGESLSISGFSVKRDQERDDTSTIYNATHSSGNGGNLTVSAPFISIGIGGSVHADTLGDETLDGNTLPDGDAGTVRLNADRLEMSGGIISASTQGTGVGGNISIEADQLKMSEQASISAESSGTGDAGHISVSPSDTIEIQNSSITTAAENAGGGSMLINAGKSLQLSNGEMTTSVKYGAGNGGDISITGPEFMILNQGSVIARAYEGAGGNIKITADHFIQSAGSPVDASSKLGIDGTVNIASPDEDISSGLTVLPETYLDADTWMKTPCAARTGEKISRFTIKGRDGVQTAFDDWLPSPRFPLTNKD
jgi:filamentous hemagglutinin family protein